jgi:hypothetical protein
LFWHRKLNGLPLTNIKAGHTRKYSLIISNLRLIINCAEKTFLQ